ncbi:hypothetical protein MTR67_013741 [Solanum verrucosum]|uniref:Uncharacterized protein n=1 Tax=Solanum verrucosum TaxID=315347 RepID=A0AAF0QBT5_SOLVR|nr:hypothetical protein MTR67_013741 [Solanum verrucosum]
MAEECLQQEKPYAFSSPSAVATLLTQLAMGQGSEDNINVILW